MLEGLAGTLSTRPWSPLTPLERRALTLDCIGNAGCTPAAALLDFVLGALDLYKVDVHRGSGFDIKKDHGRIVVKNMSVTTPGGFIYVGTAYIDFEAHGDIIKGGLTGEPAHRLYDVTMTVDLFSSWTFSGSGGMSFWANGMGRGTVSGGIGWFPVPDDVHWIPTRP